MPDGDLPNQQVEELQVIESIFADLLKFPSNNRIHFEISNFFAEIELPSDYPAGSPPQITISAPSWSRREKEELLNELNEAYVENLGQPILYIWITRIQDQISKMAENPSTSFPRQDFSQADEESTSSLKSAQNHFTQEVPQIFSGETFSDRKSVFQAHVARVRSKNEVDLVMAKLKENNKVARATHNILAWRCEEIKNGRTIVCKDCEDDGEHQASSKMLEIIEKMGAQNVMVVVTRWYGGIHLGPDRFRIINNLTRQILADNGMENRRN
ncbi:unnamed protein product, partial [Mesorhabditis belari]|uniref:RWD domain-containing protein n=1 Tax=Mesorhabditis belari TaxID=2138241 RepID=A0AAF3J5S3_9BILA